MAFVRGALLKLLLGASHIYLHPCTFKVENISFVNVCPQFSLKGFCQSLRVAFLAQQRDVRVALWGLKGHGLHLGSTILSAIGWESERDEASASGFRDLQKLVVLDNQFCTIQIYTGFLKRDLMSGILLCMSLAFKSSKLVLFSPGPHRQVHWFADLGLCLRTTIS